MGQQLAWRTNHPNARILRPPRGAEDDNNCIGTVHAPAASRSRTALAARPGMTTAALDEVGARFLRRHGRTLPRAMSSSAATVAVKVLPAWPQVDSLTFTGGGTDWPRRIRCKRPFYPQHAPRAAAVEIRTF